MIDLSLDEIFDASISSTRATRLEADDPFVKAWGSRNLVAQDASLPKRPLRDLREPLILAPVRPNLGIQAAYRRRLTVLVEQMHKSLSYWLEAAYKANPPKIAQDELSSSALRVAMRKLSRRWLRNFDLAAKKLADYFAQDISERSDAQLKKILKDGGFSVEFKMSAAQRDVLNATIQENVSLIKSIPREYLTRVEGMVMRSVQTGRDMKQLSDDLQTAFGVSKRRAAIISRDQSNKATAMLTRARHLELGITENVWVHSRGGKTPRPTHVKAGEDGVTFDVAKGWYDPAVGDYIWPGTLINCRCVGRPVIKALQG